MSVKKLGNKSVPSPVGHTLAGLCGFMVAKNRVAPRRREWVLFVSVVIALMPDLDFLPGYLLGDLGSFHHQATHSITAAVVVGFWWAVWQSRGNLTGRAGGSGEEVCI